MLRPQLAATHTSRAIGLRSKEVALGLVALAACAAPQGGTLAFDEASAALAARVDAAHFEAVLEGLDLARSSLAVPPPEQRADPRGAAFWTTRALAWAPEVRAARREWRAAHAEAESTGAPAPVTVQVVDHEFGGEDDLVEAVGLVDLLGLLGVGPSRAERRTASAELVLALGRLELAAWRAELDVERARIACLSARARTARLGHLISEAREDLTRVAILERNGRVGAGAAEGAVAAIQRLVRRRSIADDDAERRCADLARASGVPASDPALRAVGEASDIVVERLTADAVRLAGGPFAAPSARISHHPVLREARLAFALREAMVREAAAASWPGISLGPHFNYVEDASVGAVLQLSLPFPSSWRGRLAAAVERRDAAIEAFEDALHHLLVSEEEATARLAAARARLSGATGDLDRATAARWRAARASFRVGRTPLVEWTDALAGRGDALTFDIDDAEAAALAALDLRAARGPFASASEEVQP